MLHKINVEIFIVSLPSSWCDDRRNRHHSWATWCTSHDLHVVATFETTFARNSDEISLPCNTSSNDQTLRAVRDLSQRSPRWLHVAARVRGIVGHAYRVEFLHVDKSFPCIEQVMKIFAIFGRAEFLYADLFLYPRFPALKNRSQQVQLCSSNPKKNGRSFCCPLIWNIKGKWMQKTSVFCIHFPFMFQIKGQQNDCTYCLSYCILCSLFVIMSARNNAAPFTWSFQALKARDNCFFSKSPRISSSRRCFSLRIAVNFFHSWNKNPNISCSFWRLISIFSCQKRNRFLRMESCRFETIWCCFWFSEELKTWKKSTFLPSMSEENPTSQSPVKINLNSFRFQM